MSAVSDELQGARAFMENELSQSPPLLSHVEPMRRFTAISVLLLLISSWGAPLVASVASESGAQLPACCRRGGKHHCAMMMEAYLRLASGNKPALIAPPQHCPLYPQGIPQNRTSETEATLPSAGALYADLQSHPARHSQTFARYRISFDRSRSKRGPPSFILT